MKICFIHKFSEANADGLIDELEKRGHTVVSNCDETCDIILCGSIVKMIEAQQLHREFPKIPLVVYCWDYYKWAHEGKHPYLNWGLYAAFLKRASAIVVPSEGQKLRLKELLGLDSEVVHAAIDVYPHDISDERFVLDPVRHYPEENKGWVEKACDELGIKCIHSEHQFSKEEFRKLVHSCTFMTCAYREASTGGLTLMEGLWNGKPSLVSDSPYMGARDYLGQFGTYFKHDDFEDLKSKIKEMFLNPPKINIGDARRRIADHFSYRTLADKIESICERIKNS